MIVDMRKLPYTSRFFISVVSERGQVTIDNDNNQQDLIHTAD